MTKDRLREFPTMNFNGRVWYIPHHGVYHPQKPDKIRIVFDTSAEFKGESLNRHLQQGPDLTNSLNGVLCRFRKEPIAFTCDVEGMFHQVFVNPDYRNLLRFLWWDKGNVDSTPTKYRMTVHLFGATSSSGCANFTLKRTADDFEELFGSEPATFVKKDFYVDDGLKSVPSATEASALIKSTKSLLAKGGFNLHKFISNSKEVIEAIPKEQRASVPRNCWKLARVETTYPDADGYVRKVKVAVADQSRDVKGKRTGATVSYLERPIHGLILLMSHKEQKTGESQLRSLERS